MMQRFLLLAAVFVSGCTSETSWQEQVIGADGRAMTARRTEIRRWPASSSLPGSGMPEVQRLSINDSGRQITWERRDSLALPLGFDIVNGVPWLIVDNDMPCDREPTPEPVRVFRHAAGKWHQARMADAPPGLTANLLQYAYAESRGDLGTRPDFGKCDARSKEITDMSVFQAPAFKWLRYPPYCGKPLDEVARAVARSSRCIPRPPATSQ